MPSYLITWSPLARVTYLEILEYLEENWSLHEVDSFIGRTDEVISYIEKNPFLYPYSNDSDTFKCVVVKQISLFYRKKDSLIELLIFWDNRQDPAKLLFK